jgi:hypothetical protein
LATSSFIDENRKVQLLEIWMRVDLKVLESEIKGLEKLLDVVNKICDQSSKSSTKNQYQ